DPDHPGPTTTRLSRARDTANEAESAPSTRAIAAVSWIAAGARRQPTHAGQAASCARCRTVVSFARRRRSPMPLRTQAPWHAAPQRCQIAAVIPTITAQDRTHLTRRATRAATFPPA
ncbi:MAG: hypothetical protein ACK58X_17520, partial [Planctomycetota bacterium]